MRLAAVVLVVLLVAGCGTAASSSTAPPPPSPIASPSAGGTPGNPEEPTAMPGEIYVIPPAKGAKPTDADVRRGIEILTARMALLGIEGGTVSGDASGLRVTIPHESAQVDGTAWLATPGLVEFVPLPRASYGTADSPPGPAIAVVGAPLPVPAPALFTNDLVADARSSVDETGNRAFSFTLTPAGKELFATYTRQHLREYLAIVRDRVVLAVPYIASPMTDGQCAIGGLAPADAAGLAMVLRSGALPAAFWARRTVEDP